MANRTKSSSRGRPRSNEAREAILKSTLELLDEVGYAALSIEAIAARAGVGKTTVYRWWNNKAQVVVEAFLETVAPELDFAPGESFIESLHKQMISFAKILSGNMGPVIAAIIGAGQSEPDSLEAFYSQWIEPRRIQARKLLQHAMDTGEIKSKLPVDSILDTFYGPFYFRLLVRKERIDQAYAEAVFRAVMDGICADKEAKREIAGQKKSGNSRRN